MKIGQLRGRVSATPGDRFLVKGDVRAARTIGIVLSALACLAVPLVYENFGPDRFGWSLALLAAVALIARGIFLGRPVTTAHAAAAAAVACVGLGAHFVSFGLIGNIFIGASGLTFMLTTSARPQPGPGLGAGQCDEGGSISALRHAFKQELLLQLRRGRGDRLPHPPWIRRRQAATRLVMPPNSPL